MLVSFAATSIRASACEVSVTDGVTESAPVFRSFAAGSTKETRKAVGQLLAISGRERLGSR